jgi:3' terminal RNA ribose 2'-O-methyltransferase Hen1
MLLTITTTHRPATDLGYLLHKNPAGVHRRELSFGEAVLVYPEATDERCTAALLIEVDPVGLVRGRQDGRQPVLSDYVNDRPYAASSFLSLAISRMLNTALGGRSKERPKLAASPIPLEARLPVVPVRGGEGLLRRLFEPLGYTVAATPIPLDPTVIAWGDSRYLDVTLAATCRLRDLLEHLFVLLPVLDNAKHYWVRADEVDKLLRRAGDWLPAHPDRDLITRRYLRHDRQLVDEALARLLDGGPEPPEDPDNADSEEAAVERPLTLNEQRLAAVVAAVVDAGARRVADLGCGGGRLVGRLLRDTDVVHVLGVDVSPRALARAGRHLHLDTMTPRQRERVELAQGALTYRDRRLEGFDVACAVEVVEHLDPPRLAAFERVVFHHARPGCVVVTTPNVEYNALFATLPAGELRHRDHRFEWTRTEFADWADRVGSRHGYTVRIAPIGPEDADLGPPTQMAVFRR